MSDNLTSKRIAIIDYGVGNLRSIENALSYIGVRSQIVSSPTLLETFSGIILPGVGAFGEGMKKIQIQGFVEVLKKWAEDGKPLLGVCLGMQLLFTSSDEQGYQLGLNLIPGRVEKLKADLGSDQVVKIPHIGWNLLETPIGRTISEEVFLSNLKKEDKYYFVHSYACFPKVKSSILAYASYGQNRFAAVVRDANVIGCQFHPEKSRDGGLRFLREYLKVVQEFQQ
jgi:glutamine amidotransferase